MPMSLTRKEVDHIADLARLELSEAEKQKYQEQLSAILDYAASLQKLDTSGIPPTSSVLPPHSTLREDVAAASLPLADTLKNAPRKKDDQFQVPPVLE
jgi:aspartyl-tRNA(Asn)/glutamyl-tRNA(Gln) amidotransferase subunit C